MYKIILIIICLLISSFGLQGSSIFNLLSEEDIALQVHDSNRWALHSDYTQPKQWATYSEWLCFDVKNIEVEKSEIYYDNEWRALPYLIVSTPFHEYEFHISPIYEYNFEELNAKWHDLLIGAKSACFYTAHFPQEDLNSDTYSNWVIFKLKTVNGYWEEEHELSIK